MSRRERHLDDRRHRIRRLTRAEARGVGRATEGVRAGAARRTIDLLPAALLAALVVTHLRRRAGARSTPGAPALVLAADLYGLRLPFVLVAIAAAVAAALLRALA